MPLKRHATNNTDFNFSDKDMYRIHSFYILFVVIINKTSKADFKTQYQK